MEDFVVEPEVVYVFDKNEVLITVFKKDDKDTLINPRIHKTQNAETTFSFSISQKNPKWEQIKNPENLYLVEDKFYSTNFEGCFTETISDSNEDLVSVIAYERQKLLTRKYVRAWNSTTGFENIDTFMVVILANGDLGLKNDGTEVYSYHQKGTSGYVLDGLLYGTGWTTGTCDVEGTFDLETDQIDIYENILKVQEIWGGILVFDSLNKVVHHRDETKYLPYSGYEVKYQKNMQSLEKIHNNKIITKLCPLGEGGLNIKNVNDGSEWLTNFEYTTSVLEGIENNADITDQEQLKKWGERKLQELCKPRKELTVEMVLLQKVPGYELETLDLNDIVDVINFQYSKDIEQLRVVDFEYGLWDYSDAVIELSDITLESTDIFKKNVQATNSINDGTLNSDRVVVYHKNGDSLTNVILQIDETIINTKSELTIADDEIKASVEEVTINVDNLNNEIVSQSETVSDLIVSVGEISASVEEIRESTEQAISDLQLNADELSYSISKTGGNNLVKNSAMINGTAFWISSVRSAYYESDTPPENPAEGDYWYCTSNYQSYVADQMYYYENGTWRETVASKKILDNMLSLLTNVSSSDNFADGTRAAEKTMSGKAILFDGKSDFSVTHIFCAATGIPLNDTENYITLSYSLKNSSIMGQIYIGVMFLHLEEMPSYEVPYSIYEPAMLYTPDDLTDLTKVVQTIKIPRKTDFIEVIASQTAPEDTSMAWLDTTINLPKQYNTDTSSWEIMQTTMSLYEHTSRHIWTFRLIYGFYYETPVNFDEIQIKTMFPVFTFYPAFNVYTGDTEPTPQKGLYWNNQTTDLVKRAKYNDTGFVEWETLPISSSVLPTGTVIGLPQLPYIVPVSGYYEVADIRLEYNSIATSWTQYPGEVYGKRYKMDESGFSIESGQNVMYIDEDEILATYKDTMIFQIDRDKGHFKKAEIEQGMTIGDYYFEQQPVNDINMLLLY